MEAQAQDALERLPDHRPHALPLQAPAQAKAAGSDRGAGGGAGRRSRRRDDAGVQEPDGRKGSDVRDVSSRQDWVVVWSDRADGRAYRDHSRSRRLALNAACDLIAQQHTVQRIVGPEGVTIGREEIERYCRARPRLP
jgi:hypothetical protein